MTAKDGLRPLTSEDHFDRVGTLIAHTFGFPAETAPAWFDQAGRQNVRGYWRAGELVGGLLFIPMGQFWGGRAVSLGGLAGVAIAPHARGSGEATGMLRSALLELREQGLALAGLYPSTQPLYRRVGFEQAGLRCAIRGPLGSLPRGERSLAVRPMTPADLPSVQALYTEQAQARPGSLDRGPYVWGRVQRPRSLSPFGFVVHRGASLEGYAFIAQQQEPSGRHQLVLSDLQARSLEGWGRLFALLQDHGSLADHVSWHGGLDHPVLLLAPEQRLEVRVEDTWMIRVLDVTAALEGRGYPPGQGAVLELEVEDPLLAGCSGRWRLEVSGGQGRVRQGGEGALRCDARALACMYSGLRRASELARLGLLSGTDGALEAADGLFAGPPASMSDFF